MNAVYVKFFGRHDDRLDAHRAVRDAVSRSECHYALTFSKPQRRFQDGDVVYMAFMTTNPDGYAIFGRAVAKRYRDGRDDATADDIARQQWKGTYRHYIRVASPEFIEGQLSDCVYLQFVIDELESRALVSTARNLEAGTGNIDPKKALRQQPGAWVTTKAAQLLSARFDQLLVSAGRIPQSFLDSLPKPEVELPDRGDDRA